MTDYKVPSLFDCLEGGKHLFDQLDMDAGDCAEYGHCVKCGKWIDTSSGENETDRFEAEQEGQPC